MELGVRVFVPMDALVYQDSANPRLRFELRPGARGPKDGTYVEINREGLRDREIPVEKPADEFRLVIVGDQFTFGTGVPVEKTYVRLLEGTVRVPEGKRLRTINLSYYSYSIEQKVELLCSRIARYQPDYVLFQADENDHVQLPKGLVPFRRLKNFLRARSRFFRLIAQGVFLRRPEVLPEAPPVPEPEPAPEPVPAFVQEQLLRLRQCLEEARVEATIVLFPNLVEPRKRSPEEAQTEGALRSFPHALGLPVYDLAPALRKHPPDSLLQRPWEPRLNKKGHAAAAEALGEYLKRLFKPRKPMPKPKAKPRIAS